ncbi:Eppin [Myotis brandtii]|uniref:Eppin n=1 Tax=Myotis brandtii TaxID=109478 RepID=S7N335_MYOBR|nr:Eppin [Myotis brandtii]
MVSSGLLRILVVSILLENVQGFSLTNLFSPRRCPRIRERCQFKERDECSKNKTCPDKKKCCVFNCGKKCLDLQQDICSLPKNPGPCMAFFRRWWYDKKNDTCSTFIYGGCQGNNNNFQTKDLCQNMCSKKRQSTHHQNHQPRVSPEDCKLPMEKGPCRAKLPRWFYNSSTYGCVLFYFGGCNGNGNNFLKKDACEKACKNI